MNKPDLKDKLIGLNSVANARDIGGYLTTDGRRVKSRRLLRSAHLHNISAEDEKRLVKDFGLKYIVDLRLDLEVARDADKQLDGCAYSHLNVYGSLEKAMSDAAYDPTNPVTVYYASKDIGLLDEGLYVRIAESDEGVDAYRAFFDTLISAEDGEAVIFHCTSGKDRTGIAAMLVLSALGVDEETVISDYLLSNDFFAESRKKRTEMLTALKADAEVIEKMPLLWDAVDVRFMTTLIDRLKERYGSVTEYLKKRLRLTDEEIESLKKKYLE